MARDTALPSEPLECRQSAEANLLDGNVPYAVASALLAISGQLAQLIRQTRRS